MFFLTHFAQLEKIQFADILILSIRSNHITRNN